MVIQIIQDLNQLVDALEKNNDFEFYTINEWTRFFPSSFTIFYLKKNIAMGNIRILEINSVNMVSIRMDEHGIARCDHYNSKLESTIKDFIGDMRRVNATWAKLFDSKTGDCVKCYRKNKKEGAKTE